MAITPLGPPLSALDDRSSFTRYRPAALDSSSADLRTATPLSSRNLVLIYNDDHTSFISSHRLTALAHCYWPEADVLPVTPDNLLKEEWRSRAIALILPGGRRGLSLYPEHVRSYVQREGGRIFTVCAGTYAVASGSSYEEEQAIIAREGLSLIPFRATGPLAAAALSPLRTPDGRVLQTPVILGPRLTPVPGTPHTPSTTRTLGSYGDGSPAVVVTTFEGGGRVVSSSSHIELRPEDAPPFSAELVSHERSRARLLTTICEELIDSGRFPCVQLFPGDARPHAEEAALSTPFRGSILEDIQRLFNL